MAQTWADSCQYKHGQPANSKKPYSQLGQNLFITTGTADVEAAILAWYNEKSLYTYSTGACKGVCGHYTQVWMFQSNYAWFYFKITSFV